MGQASGGITNDLDRFCPCMMGEKNEQNNDAKWIFCECCSTWFHKTCALISDTEFDEIMNKKEKWFCPSYECQETMLNADHNSIDIGTNLKPVYTPVDLIKCPKCNFIAKNIHGLKVHQ